MKFRFNNLIGRKTKGTRLDHFYSWAVLLCSLGVLAFTFLLQKVQSADALMQKDEVINEFKNLITGGDSYLYLRPSKVANTREVLFTLEFKGKYPLYDSSISIDEFDLKKVGTDIYRFVRTNQRLIPLGTVNPLQGNLIFSVLIPEPGNQNEQFGKRYFIKINSRNGMVEQDVYLRREGSHFSMAYKIVFFEPDYSGQLGGFGIASIKRKLRHIDPAFPVHQLDHTEGDSGWKAKYEDSTGVDIISN